MRAATVVQVGRVLSFIACFILLVIAPLFAHNTSSNETARTLRRAGQAPVALMAALIKHKFSTKTVEKRVQISTMKKLKIIVSYNKNDKTIQRGKLENLY